MSPHVEKIKTAIEPLRQQIIQHKVYGGIKNIHDSGLCGAFFC
jgi:hypothetical protein